MSKYVDKVLLYFEEIFLCILFTILPIGCLFQVLCRYVLHLPIAWTEELMRALFVWATFVGCSIAVKYNSHLGVTAIVNMFPRRVKSLAQTLIYATCTVLCAFFTYSSYRMVAFQTMLGQLLPVTRIPVAWTTASMPVGFGMMTIRFALLTANEFKSFMDDAPDKDLLMEVAIAEAGLSDGEELK